jgi:acetyl/propionyl-CoA carboxylase alpha subunit
MFQQEVAPMLKKVLIANRGEIALRIVRACRDLQIPSVAIYSQADRKLRFVREADESVEIGAAPPKESYLAIDRIIAAAKQMGADSIHPGYGFLAENADLARAAEVAGLIFIGPPSGVIEALGSKLIKRVRRAAKDVTWPPTSFADTSIKLAALGDDAVALGAVAWARRQLARD